MPKERNEEAARRRVISLCSFRRTQFVDAAITVLTREGVARATTRRMAEAVELPTASFHYCFAMKEDLLAEDDLEHKANSPVGSPVLDRDRRSILKKLVAAAPSK